PAESAALVEYMAGEVGQKRLNTVAFRIPSLNALNQPGAMQWQSNAPEMALFVDHLKVGSSHMLNEYYADGWGKIDSMLRARTADLATGAKAGKQWAQEISQTIDGMIKAGD